MIANFGIQEFGDKKFIEKAIRTSDYQTAGMTTSGYQVNN